MSQTSVSIRMDDLLKEEFDRFCENVGLSMSAAITLFAKTVVRQQRIPFEIGLDVPNAETRAALAEVAEMKKHPEQYKSYTDVELMMEDLLK